MAKVIKKIKVDYNHGAIVLIRQQIMTDSELMAMADRLRDQWLQNGTRSLRVTFVNTYVAPGIDYKRFKNSDDQFERLLAKLLAKLENNKSYASGKAKKKK